MNYSCLSITGIPSILWSRTRIYFVSLLISFVCVCVGHSSIYLFILNVIITLYAKQDTSDFLIWTNVMLVYAKQVAPNFSSYTSQICNPLCHYLYQWEIMNFLSSSFSYQLIINRLLQPIFKSQNLVSLNQFIFFSSCSGPCVSYLLRKRALYNDMSR